ncbi:MAG TPA: hypothetical protein VK842_08630 [bacterium]|jgi:hypothetical protein|nr:hypothetical protein [bacterium]
MTIHRLRSILTVAAMALPLTLAARLPEFIQPPDKDPHQQVLLDVSESGYGGVGALYDYSLDHLHSLEGGINFAGNGLPGDYWTVSGVKAAFNFWIPADFWPHPSARLLGWFAGPELRLDYVNWHYDWGGGSYNSGATYFGAGAQGGYQWIFHPGLTARLYAQADYLAGTLNGPSGSPAGPGFGGVTVGGHAAVGWSF